MRAKPVIGINTDFRETRKETPAFSYVHAGYFDAVTNAGGVPMIIPPLENEEDVDRVLGIVQGVVFVGGGDLDPRNDGFMLHPAVRTLEARREKFDRMLMGQAADRRLPVLGIGVGMQLLNVSQGGNLFLHIPEDQPKALPHRDSIDKAHRHSLNVVPKTIMARVYGDSEIRVNSMHHMACDEIAPGFVVSARAPDGIVEAIESEMPDWFAFGTQFHPEAESASALDARIFEEFIDGVKGKTGATRLKLVA